MVLKSALPGMMTGIILALAIACGETAPLIYTAGFSNTLPHSLTGSQFPYLTYMVFTGYNSPETQYHYLAYDASLILVVIVLLLLVTSRVIVARTQRYSEGSRVAIGRGPRWRCGGGRRRTSRCSGSLGRHRAERRGHGRGLEVAALLR